MDEQLNKELIRETEELRKFISAYATRGVVGSIYMVLHPQFGASADEEDSPKLSSKVRQAFFLLGLMLTTEEPQPGKDFGKDDWKIAAKLLESIFNKYFYMFLRNSKEIPDVSDEQLDRHGVAMTHFLSYFNNGLLASFEQVVNRIKQYLIPFDSELKTLLGISATDSLEIAEWLHQKLQKQNDELMDSFYKAAEIREQLIKRTTAENWSEERQIREMRKPENALVFERTFNLIDAQCQVRFEEIEAKFGREKARAYWKNYVAKRGEFEGFQYLTERNIAEEKTLLEIKEGVAFCLSANVLYWAILRTGEQTLLDNHKASYEKRRGKIFDKEVENAFRKYFPQRAVFLPNVYETRDLHNEHDLIIVWENKLFIIEAKSSPPREPFRNLEKAVTRIEREFQSKSGIQGAFDQAIRIYRKLKSGQIVELYDDQRNLVITLKPNEIKQIYCIGVTRDNFGPVATDLSILLDKKEAEPYPWIIDIYSLEAFFDAWKYFDWKPYKFCEYLNQRQKVHGKIFASEELEVAGFFIRHGRLDYLTKKNAPKIVLNSSYSDVFDEIYKTKYGGNPVVYKPTQPFMTDSREILRRATTGEKFGEETGEKVKLGVNDPCFCGSGRKYKKCHLGRS
jgi:hypothetical protein